MWTKFCSSTHPRIPRRFLIDAVVPRVPENKVGRGFSWLARNINISVTHALLGRSIGVLTFFNLKISSLFAKFP
jgi:hypothetical protein